MTAKADDSARGRQVAQKPAERFYLQVLQDFPEQVEHPAEEETKRLLPPPIPKVEGSLRTPDAPQPRQTTSFSRPILTRHSNR